MSHQHEVEIPVLSKYEYHLPNVNLLDSLMKGLEWGPSMGGLGPQPEQCGPRHRSEDTGEPRVEALVGSSAGEVSDETPTSNQMRRSDEAVPQSLRKSKPSD